MITTTSDSLYAQAPPIPPPRPLPPPPQPDRAATLTLTDYLRQRLKLEADHAP